MGFIGFFLVGGEVCEQNFKFSANAKRENRTKHDTRNNRIVKIIKYRYSNQFNRTMHNKSHLPRDEKAPHTLTIRRNVPGISWDSSVAI